MTVIDAGLAAELAQRGLDMANIVTVGRQDDLFCFYQHDDFYVAWTVL